MFLKKKITLLIVFAGILFLAGCTQEGTYRFFDNEFINVALVLPESVNNSPSCAEAYKGLQRFKSDYKAKIGVVENVKLKESRKVFKELAERKFNLIIAFGHKYAPVMKRLSRTYPEVFFCTIYGNTYQSPNLCSFNFKDEIYGYLIGIAGGLTTSTNKVGLIVAEKSSSSNKTIIGMKKGLKSVNPKADLVISYIKSANNLSISKEAAVEQINSGVDVISHLLESGGIGVIKAAEEADISAIGSVINQHDLAPNIVITSGLKDISQLIYLVCENYLEKKLQPTNYSLGLKDQVLDLAQSYGNIDTTTEAKINRIKNQLIDSEISGEKN